MWKHLVVVVAVLAPVPGTAQSGPYRLEEGDTLRYREISNGEVTIRTPQGAIMARSEHDATIGLVGDGPSGAIAWYEALRLRSVGPEGDRSPDTGALIGEVFTLRFPRDGRVELVAAPTLPAPVAAISDVSNEFHDFFVSMPEREPSVGDSWQDTIQSNRSGIPGTTQAHRAIRMFEVTGDTMVAGTRALRIGVTTRVRLESTSPVEDQPVTVTTTLEGEDTGFVVFDWSAGRILYRSRRGTLTGTFSMDGGGQSADFPQSLDYTSTIEAVR